MDHLLGIMCTYYHYHTHTHKQAVEGVHSAHPSFVNLTISSCLILVPPLPNSPLPRYIAKLVLVRLPLVVVEILFCLKVSQLLQLSFA
jgi:hypothetical protein